MPAAAISYSVAKDTVFGMINGVWLIADTIIGYFPEVRWQGNEIAAQPAVDKIWARVSYQIVTDEQVSLTDNTGRRLFHAVGLVYVQIFAPRTAGDITTAIELAKAVRKALRGNSTDGNVWLTKAKIVELAPDDFSYPILVSATFEYDDLNQ